MPINIQHPSEEIVTQITDVDGALILSIGMREYTVTLPGQAPLHRKVSQSIQLVDGAEWSPVMAMGANPVRIGVCGSCRHPPFRFPTREILHGLVRLSKAKICNDCGQLVCPRCRKLGIDKRWRCLRCHRKHRTWRFLKSFVVSYEEVD
jgi:hypothetical protein